jgi:hypothetical protein
MAYNGKPFFRIPRPLLLDGGVESLTLSGNITLDDKSSLFLIIDGGGSNRNVILPPEKNGRLYCIQNSGTTNDLAVQNDAAGGVITLSPGEVTLLVSDGVTWYPIINVDNL